MIKKITFGFLALLIIGILTFYFYSNKKENNKIPLQEGNSLEINSFSITINNFKQKGNLFIINVSLQNKSKEQKKFGYRALKAKNELGQILSPDERSTLPYWLSLNPQHIVRGDLIFKLADPEKNITEVLIQLPDEKD